MSGRWDKGSRITAERAIQLRKELDRLKRLNRFKFVAGMLPLASLFLPISATPSGFLFIIGLGAISFGMIGVLHWYIDSRISAIEREVHPDD